MTPPMSERTVPVGPEPHENHCSPDRCRWGVPDCPVRVAGALPEVNAADLAAAMGRPESEAAAWLAGLRSAALARIANLDDQFKA